MRSLHYFAILRDFEISFLARVLSALMASSWKTLLECYEKNILKHWMSINLKIKSLFSSPLWCFSRIKCINCLMSSGTTKFKDTEIRVIMMPMVISWRNVKTKFLNREYSSEERYNLSILLKSWNRGLLK